MRRITIAVMSTVSALVALFSYHTSLHSTAAGAAPLPEPAAPRATPSATPTAQASSSTSSKTSSSTYTGTAEDTQWGVVQVRITVAGGKITKSEAVQYPWNNHRDQEINGYAIPQLNDEAVQQQSGSIDAVSGATVTSDGYIRSLQSAVDQAHL